MKQESPFHHVAVAVVTNSRGEVLISKRPEHAHQGGLWEFPGGKLEAGEDVYAALVRELQEELGINVQSARPLIRIPHDYPDKAVLLDVWRVTEFSGEPQALEGQEWEWVTPTKLYSREFPAANRPIVTAVNLPSTYLITPEPGNDHTLFLQQLEHCLQASIRLVQLRAKTLEEEQYRRLAFNALAVCGRYQAALLLNAAPALVTEINAAGVHLTSECLMSISARPLGTDKWVAASVHNTEELEHACHIGVDFVVSSPVMATASHPELKPMGWEKFQCYTEQSSLPVYALGGMTPVLLPQVFDHGGQGIAAIRGLWNNLNMENHLKE